MWITDVFTNRLAAELKDPFQFVFDLPRELERIQRVSPLLELSDFGGDGLFGGADTLERSLRRITDPF